MSSGSVATATATSSSAATAGTTTTTTASASVAAAAAATGGQEIVKALYSYDTNQESHLPLVCGEFVVVLEKDPSGWWIGRNFSDGVGLFPANYTAPVTSEEFRQLQEQIAASDVSAITHVQASRHTQGGVGRLARPNMVVRQPRRHEPELAHAGATTRRAKQLLSELGLDDDDDGAGSSASSQSGGEDEEREGTGAAGPSSPGVVQSPPKPPTAGTPNGHRSFRRRSAGNPEVDALRDSVKELGEKLDEANRISADLSSALKTQTERANTQRNALGVQKQHAMRASRAARKYRTRYFFLRKHFDATQVSYPEPSAEDDFSDDSDEEKSDTSSSFLGSMPMPQSLTASSSVQDRSSSLLVGPSGLPDVQALQETVAQQNSEIESLRAQLTHRERQVTEMESKLAVSSEGPAPPIGSAEYDEERKQFIKQINQLKKLVKLKKDQIAVLEKEKEKRDAEPAPVAAAPPPPPPPPPPQPPQLPPEHFEKLKTLEAEVEQLRRDAEAKKQKIGGQLSRLSSVQQSSVVVLRESLDDLRQDYVERTRDLFQMLRTVAKSIPKMMASTGELLLKYKKEQAERRKLFNQLQELRGNIRVVCRVRPLGVAAVKETRACVRVDDKYSLMVEDAARNRLAPFEFDAVFGPESTQPEVFEDVKALATSVLDGYNVCIFAYGQTGSGKTHTMEGDRHSEALRGINFRTVAEMFDIISSRSPDWEYTLDVSVIEIYNENIYDLLCQSGNPRERKLEIRQTKNGLEAPDLVRRRVSDVFSTLSILDEGYANRAVQVTNMNEHSSRSHCALMVWVEGFNTVVGTGVRARLNLVDLAGSERVKKTDAKGDRLTEAKNINRSLSALGNVIQSLQEKKSHTPYRDSKLTILLQDSLGGDSKVNMIVNVSPAVENVTETISSLTFASRARSVELGKAEKNVVRGRSSSTSAGPSSAETPGAAADDDDDYVDDY